MIKKPVLFLFSVLYVFGLGYFSVFESGDLPMGVIPLSGAITQGVPFNPNEFTAHFLLAEVYMGLYRLMPNIPWYEIILFFYMAVSLFFILYVIDERTGTYRWGKVILFLMTLVLFTENIMLLQYTRVAFCLGMASTLLLFSGVNAGKGISMSLFTICILTRWEVGVFVTVVQVLLVLSLFWEKKSDKILFFNLFAVACMLGYIVHHRGTTTEYAWQFQPELGYQLLDRGNIVPLGTMKNTADSTKYIAVQNMISDPDYITIGFLQSLVRENAYWGIDEDLVARFGYIFTKSLKGSLGLFVIYLCVFAYGLCHLMLNRDKKIKGYILFHAGVWVFISLVMYLIKMEVWLFNSVLLMLSLLIAVTLDYSQGRRVPRAVFAVPGLVLCVGIYWMFRQQVEYSGNLKRQIRENIRYIAMVEDKYSGKMLVPDISGNQAFLNQKLPFRKVDYSGFKRVYLFDMDVLYLIRQYNDYLRKECKCNASDYAVFMDFLRENGEEVIFMSTPERIKIIDDYCTVVRKRDYSFILTDSITDGHMQRFFFTFDE